MGPKPRFGATLKWKTLPLRPKIIFMTLSSSLPPKSGKKSETSAQHQIPRALATAESQNQRSKNTLRDRCPVCGPFFALAPLRSHAQPSSPTPPYQECPVHTQPANSPSPGAAEPPPGTHHRSPSLKARAGRLGIRYRGSRSIRANNFSLEVEGGGGSGAW